MVGISLEDCNCRLLIGYVDDVRFTWYTFGGMDSWMGWNLLLVLFQLWIYDTCDYLYELGISVGTRFYDLLM